jgi:hypothetical protein
MWPNETRSDEAHTDPIHETSSFESFESFESFASFAFERFER